MIEVLIDPERCYMSVSGHAMYAEPGQDIVCAGASTLAFTLAERVVRLSRAGYVIGHDLYIDKGILTLEAMPMLGDGEGLCREAFETIQAGYEVLAVKYPDRVRMV